MNNFVKAILFISLAIIGGIAGSRLFGPQESSDITTSKTQLIEKRYYIQENEALAQSFLKAKKIVGHFSCPAFYQNFEGDAAILTRDGLAATFAEAMPATCKGKIIIEDKEYDFAIERQSKDSGLSLLKIQANDLNAVALSDAESEQIGRSVFGLDWRKSQATSSYGLRWGYIQGISGSNIFLDYQSGTKNNIIFDTQGRLLGIAKDMGPDKVLITISQIKELLNSK